MFGVLGQYARTGGRGGLGRTGGGRRNVDGVPGAGAVLGELDQDRIEEPGPA
ncbi:hypothetical protein ACFYNM_21520 [Streptomyces spororaveus]|uniref:hypothetical protein n=1 Tax=Streptomyces spororaveus TaxID=284039 RepID=UPI0036763A5A